MQHLGNELANHPVAIDDRFLNHATVLDSPSRSDKFDFHEYLFRVEEKRYEYLEINYFPLNNSIIVHFRL